MTTEKQAFEEAIRLATAAADTGSLGRMAMAEWTRADRYRRLVGAILSVSGPVPVAEKAISESPGFSTEFNGDGSLNFRAL